MNDNSRVGKKWQTGRGKGEGEGAPASPTISWSKICSFPQKTVKHKTFTYETLFIY